MKKLVCKNCGKEIAEDKYCELYHVATGKYGCGPKDKSVAE